MLQTLDLILLLIIIFTAWRGWRHGFIVSVLFSLGLLLGFFVGVLALPKIFNSGMDENLRIFLIIFTLGIFILAGGFAGLIFGKLLKIKYKSNFWGNLDGFLGMVTQTTILFLVILVSFYPLRTLDNPTIKNNLDNSKIVGELEKIAPNFGENISNKLKEFFSDAGFPDISGSINLFDGALPEPDLTGETSVGIKNAVSSVVKVTGYAWECNRLLSGSGYVVAPNKIITNAHVVAGAKQVKVQTNKGKFKAEVNYFNPDYDVAILTVDDLEITPLKMAATDSKVGDMATVLGFPGGGNFTLTKVRVAGIYELNSENIYNNKIVSRQVYAVKGKVRHGNSGGPLVNSNGESLGIVFAAAKDSPNTGFVITNSQINSYLQAGENSKQVVGTGACITDT